MPRYAVRTQRLRLVRVPRTYKYAGPWGQAALRLRYVPSAGGWYAKPVRTQRRRRGVLVSSEEDEADEHAAERVKHALAEGLVRHPRVARDGHARAHRQ